MYNDVGVTFVAGLAGTHSAARVNPQWPMPVMQLHISRIENSAVRGGEVERSVMPEWEAATGRGDVLWRAGMHVACTHVDRSASVLARQVLGVQRAAGTAPATGIAVVQMVVEACVWSQDVDSLEGNQAAGCCA